MKFCCVTPCLNAEKYIEETMRSVLTQTIFNHQGHFLLYVIRDGGSSDRTIEVAEKVAKDFSDRGNMQIKIYSEKDFGMYDALAKGFESELDSDVYSYQNAGDYYSKNAFEIVSEIFMNYRVYFLTGAQTIYNEKSHMISFCIPFEYSKKFFNRGFYGTLFPFVQQESTFWSGAIHKRVNFSALRKFKYAGDFYLWKTFINETSLFIVPAWLSGFKFHQGQLTSYCMDKYLAEVKSMTISPNMMDFLLVYIYKYCPHRIRKRFYRHLFMYDNAFHEYRLSNSDSELYYRR